MADRARAAYRTISRVLPRELRERAGSELEDAALACLTRERARGGALGAARAWLVLLADAIATAIAARGRRQATPNTRGRAEAHMDNLRKDVAYTLRALGRQPGFAAITILTLALGIGANTAIFSVVSGVLLRPLPYPQPDRLMFITTDFVRLGFSRFWLSLPEYLELRDHATTFRSIAAYATGQSNLAADPPRRVTVAGVSPNFIETLGVAPRLGRAFTVGDAEPNAPPVAILSFELWQRAYGGDPRAVGSSVLLDAVSTEIVGVMPPGYDVHEEGIELWVPFTIPAAGDLAGQRGSHSLYAVGRLKDGVSAPEARADISHLTEIWSTLPTAAQGHVPDPTNHAVHLSPLKEDIVGGITRSVAVLQGAVLFVLIIACANLANLLLARADARQREFAVRSALGAGRWRLFAQFLTEGLVLTAIGSAIGIALSAAAVRGLVALSPGTIPRASEISLDGRVLAFTLLLAAVTGLVFALAPLLHLRSQPALSLRDGARTSPGGRRAVRGGLVAAEVALAVTLVAGAGLLIRSFVNLLRVDAGFNRSHLVTFAVTPPVVGNPQTPDEIRARRQRFIDLFERIRSGLAAVPGVRSATSMSDLPPNHPPVANATDIQWIPNATGSDTTKSDPRYPAQNVDYWQYVGRDFMETLGVPIVKGRAFEGADVAGEPVALVNESFVRKFFPDRDPIGEHLKPGFGDSLPWFRIVGVLKDVKQAGVDQPAGTELYLFEDQLPRLTFVSTTMNFVARTDLPIESLGASIHAIVHDADPSLPVVNLRSMDDVFGASVARPAFLTALLGLFAGLAVALAAVGTYGILSYVVSERIPEIGIRMALGADRGTILRDVLGRGLRLTGAGLAIGLAAAVALTRLLASLLFGVSPADMPTLAVVCGLMAAVSLLASFIPAWRATRVDPLVVFRQT